MAVMIEESGMCFGPYSEEQIFQMETSPLYTTGLRPKGIKCCEFVLLRNNKLHFIEAKKTCPMYDNHANPNRRKADYQTYVEEIVTKMRHSLALYANILLGQYDENAIPPKMRENLLADKEIRLILVVKNAKTEWLIPFKDLFEQQLRNDMRIWKIQNFIIMNEETAYKRHFITKIVEEQTDGAALAAPLKRDQ